MNPTLWDVRIALCVVTSSYNENASTLWDDSPAPASSLSIPPSPHPSCPKLSQPQDLRSQSGPANFVLFLLCNNATITGLVCGAALVDLLLLVDAELAGAAVDKQQEAADDGEDLEEVVLGKVLVRVVLVQLEKGQSGKWF